MHQLSRRVERWIKGVGLALTAVFTVGAVVMLPHVEPSAVDVFTLPADDAYLQMVQEARSHFHDSEYIVVVVEAQDPLSLQTLRSVQHVSGDLREIGEVQSVYSLTTVDDVTLEGGVLERSPFVTLETYDRAHLSTRLRNTPLYRDLFLAPSGRAQLIYVLPRASAVPENVAASVQGLIEAADDSSVFAYGPSVARRMITRSVIPQLLRIGVLAALVILVINLLIFGSVGMAVLALLAGALPAVWVVALCPVFDFQLHALISLAPVMTMILATTYSFHVLRVMRLGSRDYKSVLHHSGPVVLGASGTTALGMASLLLTAEQQVRILSILVMAGIVFAVATSLVVLPLLTPRAYPAKVSPWDRLLRRLEYTPVLDSRRMLRLSIGVVLLLVAVGAVGITRVQHDFRAAALFTRNSPAFRLISRYAARAGGVEQLEVVVDTGSAYGVVDEKTYEALTRIHTALEESEQVSQVLSVVPFVAATHGTLTGANAPLQPRTDREVAEALETLEEGRQAMSIGSFLDGEWRRVRYLLWFSDPHVSTADASAHFDDVRAAVAGSMESHLPEAEWNLIGNAARRLRAMSYHTRGLYTSLATFTAAALIIFLLVFRRLRTVTAILLPSLTAVVVYLGFMGWVGMDLSLTFIFTAIMLLGVGNDDALYFTLAARRLARSRGELDAIQGAFTYAGVPIIQTSVIIVFGMLPLLVSTHRALHHVAGLFPVGLMISTGLTLLITPRILYRAIPGLQKKSTRVAASAGQHAEEDTRV
ncbi:MAG: efflux RND transporter permease subunit [bacterium]